MLEVLGFRDYCIVNSSKINKRVSLDGIENEEYEYKEIWEEIKYYKEELCLKYIKDNLLEDIQEKSIGYTSGTGGLFKSGETSLIGFRSTWLPGIVSCE